MCENWGYKRLAEADRKESIEEMKHADELIERILYPRRACPTCSASARSGSVRPSPSSSSSTTGSKSEAVARLNKSIALAVEVGDNGTRELLEEILISEEEHVDWLEAQLELIKQVGEQNYLAQQIRDS